MTVFPETQYPDEFRTDTIPYTNVGVAGTDALNSQIVAGPKGIILDEITLNLSDALGADHQVTVTAKKLTPGQEVSVAGTTIASFTLGNMAPAGATTMSLFSLDEKTRTLAAGERLGFTFVTAGATLTAAASLFGVVSYRTRVA